MANVEIKYNERQLRQVRRMLSAYPQAVGKVMSRGINNTVRTVRTRVVRALAQKTRLPQKTIRQSTWIRWKATYRRWHSVLAVSGRGIPLIRLKARQTRRGVSYVDPEIGLRRLLPSAFIQTMPSGLRGVFLRVDKPRLPIEKQYAAALSQIYEKAADLSARIQSETGKDLHKNIMTQVRMVLERAKRK